MPSLHPDKKRFQQFNDLPLEGSVVMINLLRFNEQAQYPDDFDAGPCSGREAYARYGAAIVPFISEVGGTVIWAGDVGATVIAPGEENWDEALLVQYPSREAFIKMATNPDYLAITPHRTAALADSRLIATQTKGENAL